MNTPIQEYNGRFSDLENQVCDRLFQAIEKELPEAESKIWHGHPVWFLEGNPVVGYSKLKDGIRLLFWSGQGFDEEGLRASGKFKAADVLFASPDDIDLIVLNNWIRKSREIQWDYKNIVKRKGQLLRLK